MNGCSRVDISASALEDLETGYWFYEAQRSGLGGYYLSSLAADVESLTVHAGVHARPYDDGVYRSLARHFPFALFYTLADEVALVVAVLDTRRSPDFLRDRVRFVTGPD